MCTQRATTAMMHKYSLQVHCTVQGGIAHVLLLWSYESNKCTTFSGLLLCNELAASFLPATSFNGCQACSAQVMEVPEVTLQLNAVHGLEMLLTFTPRLASRIFSDCATL